jgi:hypothetical protein
MRLDIPFIENPGGQCGQTCAAMMIKYFRPDFEPNFEMMNDIIKRRDGFSTFPLQISILLDHYGISSKSYSADKYETTKKNPEQFHKWFKDDYEEQMKNIDLPAYDWMVEEGIKKELFEQKKHSINEIADSMQNNTVVSVVVDDNTLLKSGPPYCGHFIVISGIEENTILVHDPNKGPFIKYPKNLVEKAFGHPSSASDCVFAFGLKRRGKML